MKASDGDSDALEVVSEYQQAMRDGGEYWTRVADVLERILNGERDEDVLCEHLSYKSSFIIHTILEGIKDPDSLKDLMEEGPEEEA